jgi:hypothetical protein
MRTIAAVVVLVLATTACAEKRVAPSAACIRQRIPIAATQFEKVALSHSSRMAEPRCEDRSTFCRVSLRHRPKEMVVSIDFLYVEPSTGVCYQAPGDVQLNVYRANGEFIRTLPGF